MGEDEREAQPDPYCATQISRGHHVRIGKTKNKFAKGGDQNYTTHVFRIIKVIRRTPRPVYELEDLNQEVIDGQFFNE